MKGIQRIQKLSSVLGYVCTTIGASVLVLLLGHFTLSGIYGAAGVLGTQKSSSFDARAMSPAYLEFPELAGYWIEHEAAWRQHFEPYYHWRRNESAGKFINIDATGVRHTTRIDAEKSDRKLFMFGGSTMWGTGVADAQTIPSALQSLLGSRYEVTNFGETAYVSTQELNYLLHQLALGNIPDAVVFYDGVNDGYAGAYSPAIPRDPHYLRLAEDQEKNLTQELLAETSYWRLANSIRFRLGRIFNREINPSDANLHSWEAKVGPSIGETSQAVVQMYEAHIEQVKALALAYQFKAYFFWQPHLLSLTRKNPNAFEVRVMEEASPGLTHSQQQVYHAAKKSLSGRQDEEIYFLGDIFNDTEEAIYLDWIHLGPRGNELVAKEIMRLIGASL